MVRDQTVDARNFSADWDKVGARPKRRAGGRPSSGIHRALRQLAVCTVRSVLFVRLRCGVDDLKQQFFGQSCSVQSEVGFDCDERLYQLSSVPAWLRRPPVIAR